MIDSRFQLGHASASDWREAADDCVSQLGAISANLGFLYLTDSYVPHLGELLRYLRERTGVLDWTGAVGMGVCCTAQGYYDRPGMVVLLAEFAADGYRIVDTITDDLDDFREEHGDWVRRTGSMFGIVHADPANQRTPQLIQQLSDQLNGGFLVGGLTSGQTDEAQIANMITSGGLSGVIFDGDVQVYSGLTQGCSRLSATHRITACQGNVIIRIDDEPALEVFKRDIGELLARDLGQVSGYIFAGLPITGSDTGDYLVRNLVGIDPDRDLIAIAAGVGVGDSILFCRRDSGTAQTDLKRMLDDLRNRMPRSPRGGVYYSCLARGPNMFDSESTELHLIRDALGDVPLVGFFANGEISHNQLYGYTGVLTIF